MELVPVDIYGAYLIESKKIGDDRGFFSRFYCAEEMNAAGLSDNFVQINNSYAKEAGTLRGIHFQREPHAETKFLRCIRGAVFDVIIDIRPTSPTYLKWYGVELNDTNRLTIYIPKGCAHGIVTLVPNTEILYLVDAKYTPASEGGIRYNDPLFRIDWPLFPQVISPKDSSWPDFEASPGNCA